MPADFERCRNDGGKVRTVSGPNKIYHLSKGEYRHICILHNKVHWGEKKTRKGK